MNKVDLRAVMQHKRSMLNDQEVISKSSKIAEFLFNMTIYKEALSVMSYVNFRQEVQTQGIILQSLSSGKQVTVPLCIKDGCKLLACHITDINELVPTTLGILEPLKAYRRAVDTKDIDLVIVPGLAFDKQFNRLGFGAGYYDRFLTSLRKDVVKIALAYDFQILDSIPAQSYDIPMNFIITETGILRSNP